MDSSLTHTNRLYATFLIGLCTIFFVIQPSTSSSSPSGVGEKAIISSTIPPSSSLENGFGIIDEQGSPGRKGSSNINFHKFRRPNTRIKTKLKTPSQNKKTIRKPKRFGFKFSSKLFSNNASQKSMGPINMTMVKPNTDRARTTPKPSGRENVLGNEANRARFEDVQIRLSATTESQTSVILASHTEGYKEVTTKGSHRRHRKPHRQKTMPRLGSIETLHNTHKHHRRHKRIKPKHVKSPTEEKGRPSPFDIVSQGHQKSKVHQPLEVVMAPIRTNETNTEFDFTDLYTSDSDEEPRPTSSIINCTREEIDSRIDRVHVKLRKFKKVDDKIIGILTSLLDTVKMERFS